MEPSQDDGFKWFGEGFDGFPKRLPDNTVEYSIFVVNDASKTNADTRARLTKILKSSNQHIKHLLEGYIWQHDPFALKISDAGVAGNSSRVHLHGRTEFGDSIADEWLIVYILVEISKRHTDAWIRITDTDGEFLLIEAANALPKWLNPDVADNRVWISNGHLRLIPLKSEDQSRHNLKQEEALEFIASKKEDLIISPFVEDAAFARLKEYPAAIAGALHHALITIPRRLAYLLSHDPAYTSPAIEEFYLRDAVALRPLATKDLATLQLPPEDFVTVSIKFTKVGFAQLRGQVFDAPPSWIGIQPRMQDEKIQIGMKLTCGFEMMLADAKNKDKKVVREIQLLFDDVENEDVKLPDDKEIEAWPQRQDDEAWLTIDYNDFEAELSGKDKTKGADKGTAQDNLRKMVSRVQEFVDADTADDIEDENDTSDDSDSGEEKDGSFDEAEFEKAMKEMMGMSEQDREDQGLLDDARKLAVADGEVDEGEEDEDTKQMMRLIEEELKDAGALRRRANRSTKSSAAAADTKKKTVVFGPELPPGLRRRSEPTTTEESADEDIGPGDEELSSDDEDFNEVDVNLARNLLQSFKGQAGASGPAGNMMKALGINMPRDEDSD